MSLTGTVKNGVIVLPPGTKLPEGAEVKVETIELSAADGSLLATVERLAKPRPHLPKDYALNHGQFVRGEPKKRVKLPLIRSRRLGTVDLTNAQIEELLD
jgi:hypothetical protein